MDEYRKDKICNLCSQRLRTLERHGRQRHEAGHLIIIIIKEALLCGVKKVWTHILLHRLAEMLNEA